MYGVAVKTHCRCRLDVEPKLMVNLQEKLYEASAFTTETLYGKNCALRGLTYSIGRAGFGTLRHIRQSPVNFKEPGQ